MKRTLYIFLFLLISLNFSCFLFKKTEKTIDMLDGSKNINEESFSNEILVNTITDSLSANNMNFTSLSANFSGNYKSAENSLPLKGIIRIKEGEFIWISLKPIMGIELGRVLFTSDSIKYIDRMKNEYFMENYSYIKKMFGFDLNYKSIEAILTNRFFVYPPDNTILSYYLVNNESVKANTLSAIGIFSDINMNHSIVFSDIKNYIVSNNINLLDKNQQISFTYSEFQIINGKNFPKNIFVRIFENNKILTIDFNYKTIVTDKIFSKSFKIPDNYKRIYFD